MVMEGDLIRCLRRPTQTRCWRMCFSSWFSGGTGTRRHWSVSPSTTPRCRPDMSSSSGTSMLCLWRTHYSSSAVPSPWLEHVCLKRMTVSNTDLTLLARSFPSFRDLMLICCDGFSTPGLTIIAKLYRNMRVLDLIKNDVEDEDEELVDWISRFPETTTSLESLSFECVN
ncbi:hypothetical protein ZIOFF_034089 [Zingiber officinale]|uniref:Uncharacterized protein n=2 Tax=Zingiber officinale TaxID=94328 RepID=A0A8J5GKF4_ZINOF|nr:hypothetical protein ZIOFF_034089 [Zingiber officinale]